MDALKALAGQQGCSADGTAASRNPMSQFVNQMGKDGRPMGAQMGPRGHQQRPDLDNGMAAGMGLKSGPQINAPQMNHNMMASEFNRMQQQQGFNGPMMRGPEAQMGMMGPRAQMGDNWVQQFDNMSMGPNTQFNPAMNQSFQRNFGAPQMGQRWVNQMSNRPVGAGQMDGAWRNQMPQARSAQNWSQQMQNTAPPDAKQWVSQANDAKQASDARQSADSDAIRKATEDLVNVMSSDEKLRNSNFYSEMSKVAAGDSVVMDNEIKQVRESTVPQSFENLENDIQSVFEKAYEAQLAGEDVDLNDVFNQAMSQSEGYNDNIFESVWNQQRAEEHEPYELQANNKFSDIHDEDSLFDMGMELFKKGELRDAVLAFEAVVDKDMGNSEAWRMLGVVHQELDEDRKAIVCLETAKEQDPYNLNALLELGVSYVNELDQKKALANLKAWVDNNPKFSGVKVDDIYGDESGDLMHDVTMLMTKVEEFAPADPDVQVVLGVLYNVSRDYDDAVNAFKKALNHRPDEYSLWNKLGATLANSSKSEEALPVYTRAIELKPRYARGWLNFGISHSNLGDYRKAIRAYLRALDLNPDAQHIWNYLRICLTCSEGLEDLIPAVERKDIDAFRKVFDF